MPRIFAAFLRLGCTSFGGGTAAWLYREMVLRRGWIDDQTFLAMLALGQVMPGSNGVKMTVLIGQRLRGAPGAAAALVGLLSRAVRDRAGGRRALCRARRARICCTTMLDGVAAAVIGLTFATGLRSVAQRRPRPAALAIAAVTVLCVGVLRWPMLPVIVVLAPVSIALACARRRRRWR